jgi:hypothetical protein
MGVSFIRYIFNVRNEEKKISDLNTVIFLRYSFTLIAANFHFFNTYA